MRILVIEITYSGSRRGVHLIRSLLSYGHKIYYLTNVPITKNSNHLFRPKYREDGVVIVEVPNPRKHLPWKGIFPNVIIQLLNTVLFLFAVIKNLKVYSAVNLIIARGMHPFTEPPALLLKKLTGASLYLDVCDPLVEDLDVFTSNRLLIKLGRLAGAMINVAIYALSDGLMTHTRSMVKVIAKYTRKKVVPIYNAVDTSMFRPMEKAVALERLSGLLPVDEVKNKFVILYSGSMGPCQDLGRVLDAAKLLSNEGNIVFLLMGAGQERSMLVKRVKKEDITNVLFWPYVPWELMPYVLNVADACVLVLRNHPMYFLALPKKFFEYVACGKPVIAFCPKGEVTRLVERWGAGVVVDPDDAEGLAEAVRLLSRNRKLVLEMGRNARRMAESLFSLEKIGEQLNNLLKAALAERKKQDKSPKLKLGYTIRR